MAIAREEILKRLHLQVTAGKPIVGCGAGTGISAKMAEAGGADQRHLSAGPAIDRLHAAGAAEVYRLLLCEVLLSASWIRF